MAQETRSIELPTGVMLEYVERGDAPGVPVLLLHGDFDSWHSFERVLPVLPPSIRAFALSLRGHGDSSRPADGYAPPTSPLTSSHSWMRSMWKRPSLPATPVTV